MGKEVHVRALRMQNERGCESAENAESRLGTHLSVSS
jgi:hypothetical protein